MIPLCVQDSKYNDAVALNTVKKFVVKTPGKQAPEIAVIQRASFWPVSQHTNRLMRFLK
jgi:hypothetical protein